MPAKPSFRLVFGECCVSVGRGVERVSQKHASPPPAGGPPVPLMIEISPEAGAFWTERYSKTIPKGLRKTKWSVARATVLEMSELLGVEAAEAAVASARPGASVVIRVAHARKGSKAVEKNQRCKAAKRVGQGDFCTVD